MDVCAGSRRRIWWLVGRWSTGRVVANGGGAGRSQGWPGRGGLGGAWAVWRARACGGGAFREQAMRRFGPMGFWEGGLAHGLCSSPHADAPSSAAPPTTACGPHRHCCREPFDSRHASWPQPRTSPPPACRMTCAAHRVDPAGNQSGDALVRAGRA